MYLTNASDPIQHRRVSSCSNSHSAAQYYAVIRTAWHLRHDGGASENGRAARWRPPRQANSRTHQDSCDHPLTGPSRLSQFSEKGQLSSSSLCRPRDRTARPRNDDEKNDLDGRHKARQQSAPVLRTTRSADPPIPPRVTQRKHTGAAQEHAQVRIKRPRERQQPQRRCSRRLSVISPSVWS